jgi:hypothetical protein
VSSIFVVATSTQHSRNKGVLFSPIRSIIRAHFVGATKWHSI